MFFWIVQGRVLGGMRGCVQVMIVRLRQIFQKMVHPMGLGGRQEKREERNDS